MIIDKEIEIKIGCCSQRKHFRSAGYNCELGDTIIIKPIELSSKSDFKINVKCDVCGNEKQLSYNKYTKNTKNLTQEYCCSEKCAVKKIRITKFEHHGDENYSNREKYKNTCIKRYGIDNAGGLDTSVDKIKQTKFERYRNKNYNNIKQIKATNLEKHGVECSFENEKVKEKSKQTLMKNYGAESYMQSEEGKENWKKVIREKYGVEHNSQIESVKIKKIETCRKNHGVDFPMQNREIFSKGIKTRFKVEKYGDTSLLYQAGYEKYFLEKMEQKGVLNELLNGKSYDYILNNKNHVYHSDFLFRNLTIEIKSTWTYNESGIDINSELENEAKWQAVKDSGDEIIILWSKKEIKEYVDNLVI